MNQIKYLFSVLFVIVTFSTVHAQQVTVTADDYARAEKMLSFNTMPLVDRAFVAPTFLPDGRFWYKVLTSTGVEYVLVDPTDGMRKTAASVSGLGITMPTVAVTDLVTRRNTTHVNSHRRRGARLLGGDHAGRDHLS